MAKRPSSSALFTALAAIDRRDGAWLERQSDATRKALAPPILLRWASGLSDRRVAADVLILLNNVVNRHLYALHRAHPGLLFRLLALCGAGRAQRHQWLKMPPRPQSENVARALLAAHNPTVSEAEIDLLMRLHTRQSFAAFVVDTAVDDPEKVMEAYASYHQARVRRCGARPGAQSGPGGG